MKIIFVVGHPADVHFFRCAISLLKEHGHETSIAAVSKEIVPNLLASYGLRYELIGSNTPTLVGKALTMAAKDLSLIRMARPLNPQLIVSFGSPYAAQASAVLGVPHLAFTDTEIATIGMRAMLPFTNAVCTPASFTLDLGVRQVRFEGYKELAYLHPKRFHPDPQVLDRIGVRRDDRLVVLRFGLIESSHDIHHHGLDLKEARDRLEFVRALEVHARVVLTSESSGTPELEDRNPHLPVTAIHDLLYYATLYVGDGATMASEAGVLGTPWIYVSDRVHGVHDEQQRRYGLGFREESARDALTRAIALLQKPDLKLEWKAKRERMLEDKIDVTDFMVRLIEGWPRSLHTVAPSSYVPKSTRV